MSGHKARWRVNQPGSKPVSYPSYRRARRTAKQLSGGSVSHGSPFLLPVIAWRHIRGGAR